MACGKLATALIAAAALGGCGTIDGYWPWGAEEQPEVEDNDAPRASPSTPVEADTLDPVG